MEGFVFSVITFYFFLGALATHITFKRQATEKRQSAWKKYWTFVIFTYGNTTILLMKPGWFPILAGLVVLIGIFEVIRAGIKRPAGSSGIFILILSLILFGLLASGFLFFSFIKKEYLLFTFFVVASSDAFSQLAGQLFGKRQIFPRISPAKTLEGLLLGMLLAVLTGGLAHFIADFSFWQAILIAFIISVSSLMGDLLASAYKRWCGIKDYGKLIPGNGGVLDRFDSFLAAGSVMYLISFLLN